MGEVKGHPLLLVSREALEASTLGASVQSPDVGEAPQRQIWPVLKMSRTATTMINPANLTGVDFTLVTFAR